MPNSTDFSEPKKHKVVPNPSNLATFFKTGFSKAFAKGFFCEESGQAATEYLLLIAVSLAIILVGVAVALELRNLSDVVVARVRAERNSTVSMLVR